MKTNKKISIARYIKEDIALMITLIIICIDFMPFSNQATLKTQNVLNILTDQNALKDVFLDPPPLTESKIISKIERATTDASRKFILSQLYANGPIENCLSPNSAIKM